MGIQSRMRQRAVIKKLTQDLSANHAKYLAIMLKLLPAAMLEDMAKAVESTSEEDKKDRRRAYHKFVYMSGAIERCLSGETADERAQSLARMSRLSRSVQRGVKRYGIPHAPLYAESMSKLPFVLKSLIHNGRELTTEQEESLIAVHIMDSQCEPNEATCAAPCFYPEFGYDLIVHIGVSTPTQWSTRQILANPANPVQHWKNYRDRVARSEELMLAFGWVHWSYDYLCDYSEATISRLLEIAQPSGTSSSSVWKWDQFGISRIAREAPTENFLNEIIGLGERYASESKYARTESLMRVLGALRSYDRIPRHEDYSKAPSSVLRLCDAVCKVHFAMMESASSQGAVPEFLACRDAFAPNGTIADKRLVDMIFDQPELADRIAGIIRSFGYMDYDSISVALEHSTGSVLDIGALW